MNKKESKSNKESFIEVEVNENNLPKIIEFYKKFPSTPMVNEKSHSKEVQTLAADNLLAFIEHFITNLRYGIELNCVDANPAKNLNVKEGFEMHLTTIKIKLGEIIKGHGTREIIELGATVNGQIQALLKNHEFMNGKLIVMNFDEKEIGLIDLTHYICASYFSVTSKYDETHEHFKYWTRILKSHKNGFNNVTVRDNFIRDNIPEGSSLPCEYVTLEEIQKGKDMKDNIGFFLFPICEIMGRSPYGHLFLIKNGERINLDKLFPAKVREGLHHFDKSIENLNMSNKHKLRVILKCTEEEYKRLHTFLLTGVYQEENGAAVKQQGKRVKNNATVIKKEEEINNNNNNNNKLNSILLSLTQIPQNNTPNFTNISPNLVALTPRIQQSVVLQIQ